MLVKTLKRHRYAGVAREKGLEYDISNRKYLGLLEAVGRVRRVPQAVSAPLKEEPKSVEEKSTPKKKTAPKKKSVAKKKGTYKNKNMVSE